MIRSKLLSFGDLLKKSLDLFSRGISSFLTIQLVVFGLVFSVLFLFLAIVMVSAVVMPLVVIPLAEEQNGGSTLFVALMVLSACLLSLVVISFFVITFVALILGHLALILAIKDVNKGEVKAVKEYFEPAIRKLMSGLALFLLSGLMVGIGLLFFVLPGLVLGFFLIFSLYIFVLEDRGVLSSISLSFKMVKDHFWDIVARYLLVYLLFIAAMAFSNFIPFVNILVNIFLGIFMAIYLYLLYQDVRGKKSYKTASPQG